MHINGERQFAEPIQKAAAKGLPYFGDVLPGSEAVASLRRRNVIYRNESILASSYCQYWPFSFGRNHTSLILSTDSIVSDMVSTDAGLYILLY
jgi:hypothetical protein